MLESGQVPTAIRPNGSWIRVNRARNRLLTLWARAGLVVLPKLQSRPPARIREFGVSLHIVARLGIGLFLGRRDSLADFSEGGFVGGEEVQEAGTRFAG